MDSRTFWSIIIPSVMTFLLGYLTLRANKQKDQANEQIEQTKKNNNLLTRVLKDVEGVKTVVDDHTRAIDGISNKVDLLGDESLETLRRFLKTDYRKFKDQGYWTPEQKARWMKNFNTYTALGGNHEIAVYADDLKELPIK